MASLTFALRAAGVALLALGLVEAPVAVMLFLAFEAATGEALFTVCC